MLVPNDNYVKFEAWLMPLLDKMHDEQVRPRSSPPRLTLVAVVFSPLFLSPFSAYSSVVLRRCSVLVLYFRKKIASMPLNVFFFFLFLFFPPFFFFSFCGGAVRSRRESFGRRPR